MTGSDLPSGGSMSPPSAVSQPRKRKRGDAAAGDGAATPRRATRRSTAEPDVDGAVQWAQRAAAGALWAVRGRNRGLEDEERVGAVILALRRARLVLEPGDPKSPYAKKRIQRQGTRSSERIAGELTRLPSYLSTRRHIGIDSVQYQASVPEWKNAPSEEDKADYKTDNETLQKMGTVIMLPLNVGPRKTRKAADDKCRCSHPGSEACVEVHVKVARNNVRSQLGEKSFRSCGLDAMGEQVLKLWTAADKKKLNEIEKLIPQNKHENFMKIALKQFSSERKTDLAKYYFNVFLPRRLASLTRAEAPNAIDVSTDDEGHDQDDENNGHYSEQKSGKSRSSSKRMRQNHVGLYLHHNNDLLLGKQGNEDYCSINT
ncbi:hypothetical protein EJB05_03762 [Eragrostis curvula]|uniref:ELM2 domain-containing protein n=1 Tax=Eragrostis curvula TaxID=38414 RepID=A0A5J9W8K6_9POAL|nr:hypothetical protein EJB05_03298 [Eragrostis curvula]TVU44326.1 hypothetical protein EJB05_03762 [Eragrostis curvula]